MKERLLAYYHEVNVSAPILGDGERHMCFTSYFADRGGQYCAELTRAQWDELRRVRWGSPIVPFQGCLVPDVDYVACDGMVFQDVASCLEHEDKIKHSAWEIALSAKRAKECRPFDLCGNYEKAGFLRLEMSELDADAVASFINGFETLIYHELRDFGTVLELFGTNPSFEFVDVPDAAEVDFYALPRYHIEAGLIIKSQGGSEPAVSHTHSEAGATPAPATSSYKELIDKFNAVATDEERRCLLEAASTASQSLNPSLQAQLKEFMESVIAKSGGFQIVTTPGGAPVEITNSAPPPEAAELAKIEAQLLTAVASGPVTVGDLAESLNLNREHIRLAVRQSEFLHWRGNRVALKPQQVAA